MARRLRDAFRRGVADSRTEGDDQRGRAHPAGAPRARTASYYGVFDTTAYKVEKGTVTLLGYAYRGDLRSDAETAVKRVAGIDEVQNKIELLPASQNDHPLGDLHPHR